MVTYLVMQIIKGKLKYEQVIDKFSEHKEEINSISKEGKTVIFFVKNQEYIGYVGISDEVRPTSKAVVDKLNKLGVESIMITGDNNDTANAIAKSRFKGNKKKEQPKKEDPKQETDEKEQDKK